MIKIFICLNEDDKNPFEIWFERAEEARCFLLGYECAADPNDSRFENPVLDRIRLKGRRAAKVIALATHR